MEEEDTVKRVTIKFKNDAGKTVGPLVIPVTTKNDDLKNLGKDLMEDGLSIHFRLYYRDREITTSLNDVLTPEELSFSEQAYVIEVRSEAAFNVRSVTRCSSSLGGHTGVITVALFSPDGVKMATGGGDNTVRLWDLNTETPKDTCLGHSKYVTVLSWSACGTKLASGDMNGGTIVWAAENGQELVKLFGAHKGAIGAIAWEPTWTDQKIATGARDHSIVVWKVPDGTKISTLNGHSGFITGLRWGGTGRLYSCSRDCLLMAWNPYDGTVLRKFEGHKHWVNTFSLNTDYTARSLCLGIYHSASDTVADKERVLLTHELQLVSASDDRNLILWSAFLHMKVIMTGHTAAVVDVKFSPCGKLIASASFDKKIMIWNHVGIHLFNLVGHVQEVYQISWAPDSRMLVSVSADSTAKTWTVGQKKMAVNLPGHTGRIFAVDWSPDSKFVVSGGEDKLVKIWRQ